MHAVSAVCVGRRTDDWTICDVGWQHVTPTGAVARLSQQGSIPIPVHCRRLRAAGSHHRPQVQHQGSRVIATLIACIAAFWISSTSKCLYSRAWLLLMMPRAASSSPQTQKFQCWSQTHSTDRLFNNVTHFISIIDPIIFPFLVSIF